MYLTFEEYVIMGGTLQALPFAKFNRECQSILDSWTQNKLQEYTDIPEYVKYLIFDMIDILVTNQFKIIKSENVGAISVSYESNENIAKARDKEIYRLINTRLSGKKGIDGQFLLFRGV